MTRSLRDIFVLAMSILFIVLSCKPGNSQTNAGNTDFQKRTFCFKKINNHQIMADVYTTGKATKQPAIVYFHGGGFIFGNREIGLQPVLRDALSKNNYIIVSADYRLAPETKMEQIQKDAEAVYAWTVEKGPELFGADTDKIIVMGASAGGHLALHLGLQNPKPKAVVVISSPVDYSFLNLEMGDVSILKTAPEYSVVGLNEISYGDQEKRLSLYFLLRKNQLFLYDVFGFDVSKNTKRFKSMLPVDNLDSEYPPTLILHAKIDDEVPYEQAETLDAAMNKMKIKHELYTVNEGHSSRLIRGNPDAVKRIGTFIEERMAASPK